MKKQTDFKEPIKSKGCYFMVMLNIAATEAFLLIHDEDVYSILEQAQKAKGWNGNPVAQGCYLNDPAEIANLFFKRRKIKKRLIQVGVEENGERHFWDGDKFHYTVCDFSTETGKHFLTDWYNPDPTVKLGKLNKVIFYRVQKLGG